MRKLSVIFFVLSLSVGILATSCSRQNTQKQLVLADSLQMQLTKAQTLLQSVDTNRVKSYTAALSQQLAYVQRHYNDTLNRESATWLLQCKQMNASFAAFLKSAPSFEREINYSYQQIANLKTDLANNAQEPGLAQQHINAESDATRILSTNVSTYVDAMNKNFSHYDSLNTLLTQLVEKIKKGN